MYGDKSAMIFHGILILMFITIFIYELKQIQYLNNKSKVYMWA